MTLFAHSKFDKGRFNLQDTHLYRRRIAKAILDDVHDPVDDDLRVDDEQVTSPEFEQFVPNTDFRVDDEHDPEGDPKGLREEFEAIVFVNSDCFYFHIAILNDFLLIAYFRWTSSEFACYKTSKEALTIPYQKEDEA
jgi:hypothetical protein